MPFKFRDALLSWCRRRNISKALRLLYGSFANKRTQHGDVDSN